MLPEKHIRLIQTMIIILFLCRPFLVVFAQTGVMVLTDRAEYQTGEKINIKMTNHQGKIIFSHIGGETAVFCIQHIEKKNTGGKWKRLFAQCQTPHCIYDIDAPREIKSGKTESMMWSPLIFVNGTSRTMQPVPGVYRLLIRYEDNQKSEWKSVYTNQFIIH